jgi:RNA polymerase sigma-70 factor, ECF subfamily
VEDVRASDIPVIDARSEVDWTAIFAGQRQRLLGLAMVILQEGNDAADAVQSAFEKGFRHRDQLRAGVGPEAWLARITCNEAISLARRRRIRRWVSFGDSDEPGVHEEAAILDRIVVEDALRHLRPKHRAVVALHYLHGYGIDEIGSILGIPRGTVASRLHHARETLRKKLAKHRTES